MAHQAEFMRYASPMEARPIIRENLGIYNAVIAGAVYDFPDGSSVGTPEAFFGPLRECVESHPLLYAIVQDAHTEKPFFKRVHTVDLTKHISIISTGSSPDGGLKAIEEVVTEHLDKPFPPEIPPWRIAVLPLGSSQCFVCFAFSHGIGDGPTGMIFHRTFLEACRKQGLASKSGVATILAASEKSMAEPFDTPERLPISWSFLLTPLIKAILPIWLAKLLGTKATAWEVNEHTWTGAPTVVKFDGCTSRVKARELSVPCSQDILKAARKHEARLTGLMVEIFARALGKAIEDPKYKGTSLQISSGPFDNFVSTVPINMRHTMGASSHNEMGNMISGDVIMHPRADDATTPFGPENWNAARATTQRLAVKAVTLQDQPVGLLRYVPSLRKWMLGNLGRRRDTSFEVSNLGAFDDQGQGLAEGSETRMRTLFFAQPGHILDAPISLNLAGVKGGSIAYTVTWAAGCLGVGEDADEAHFVDDLCVAVEADLEAISAAL